MDLYETHTHSFVIKVWLEEVEPTCWRGYITHVPDGQRKYIQDLGDIMAFISSYLKGMGVQFGLTSWLKHRFRTWRLPR
jgi:hypothetical protein